MLEMFREVVLCDFEFRGSDRGERPHPVCVVAWELRSGRRWRWWLDNRSPPRPPYPTDSDTLFVAYYASAETGCHLPFNWPMPARVLDLCVEFKNLTNGLKVPAGRDLIGALTYYGCPIPTGVHDKENMRARILRGPPWGRDEPRRIVAYCESDVVALSYLLPAMMPKIDLPRAIYRGRYMVASSRMEFAGVPTDVPLHNRLCKHWTDIENALITAVDRVYGVFDGGRQIKEKLFSRYLAQHNIPWPQYPNGHLILEDDTFKDMANAYPQLRLLRELRSTLAALKLRELTVGLDGRNRALLGAFSASSSRNLPSNKKFIFGPAVWVRGLIKPSPGHAVVYLDWEQQEFGIAAYLSGDKAMQVAYESGDAYLAFAKQAGAIPPDGIKEDYESIRDLYKSAVLGVQYGQEEHGLAARIGCSLIVARSLLAAHRQVYRQFWEMSEAAVDVAALTGGISTVFGWRSHVHPSNKKRRGSVKTTSPEHIPDFNPRSYMNFPMQANAAEMLRLACCLATERGVEVCAPVHDAMLIHTPIEHLEANVATARAAMMEASRIVLNGFELRVEEKVVKWPGRYMDKRGREMWDVVMALLDAVEHRKSGPQLQEFIVSLMSAVARKRVA